MLHREVHRRQNIGWLRAAVLGANGGLISTSSLVVGVAETQSARADSAGRNRGARRRRCHDARCGIIIRMTHDLSQTIVLLERTPKLLDAWLRDLPDVWTRSNEGDGSWSAFDVVGHLIRGEYRDWIPRMKTVLERGEGALFDRFDRFAQLREDVGKSLPVLLDEFARARAESLAELRTLNLRPEDLAKRGRHPVLGTVTLAQLLSTWAAHDLTHLHQISRVMAHQYRDAVGPWTRFLGVFHCEGHSEP